MSTPQNPDDIKIVTTSDVTGVNQTKEALVGLEGQVKQTGKSVLDMAELAQMAAKQMAAEFNTARLSAENLFVTSNNASAEILTQMRSAAINIRAQAAVLQEAQTAFGKYSPQALEFSTNMTRPAPDLMAKSFQDTVLGSGTSESVAKINAETRAYQQTLNELIAAEGGVTARVLALADAFEVTTPKIEAYRQEMRLMNEGWAAPIGPTATPAQLTRATTNSLFGSGFSESVQADLASMRAMDSELQSVTEAMGANSVAARGLAMYYDTVAASGSTLTRSQQLEVAAFNQENTALKEQAELFRARNAAAMSAVPQGPQLPAGISSYAQYQSQNAPQLSQSQVVGSQIDAFFGTGSSATIREQSSALAANKAALQEVVQYYGAGSQEVKNFAASMGMGTAETKNLIQQLNLGSNTMGQFARGVAAGLLQFSLLAGLAVVTGRAVAEFTTGAVASFRTLESAAQELTTVQVGLNIDDAEAALQRLEKDVPATLSDIKTAFYEVSSIGGQQSNVSEQITKQIATGAAAAHADTKIWTDDVIGSMNTFHLWGATAQETYQNVQTVQAQFFQAAKDSIATPDQLAKSWGPVAQAISAAGGSMEDGLALMVAASRGAGDFSQNMTTVYRVVNSFNTDKVQQDLNNFGIATRNYITGEAIPFTTVLQQLHDKIKDLPLAQQTSIVEQLFPEARANRGANLLLDAMTSIQAEYGNLGNSAGTYNTQMESYLNTQAARVQELDNQFEIFRQNLGKRIDPIKVMFDLLVGGKSVSEESGGNPFQFIYQSLLGTLASAVTSQPFPDLTKGMQYVEAALFHQGPLAPPTTFLGDTGPKAPPPLSAGPGVIDTQYGDAEKEILNTIEKEPGAIQKVTDALGGMRKAQDDVASSVSHVSMVIGQTPLEKWSQQWLSVQNAINGAQQSLEVVLRQQVGQGFVKSEFSNLPSEFQNIFSSGIGTANTITDNKTNAAVNQMSLYAAQVQSLQQMAISPDTTDTQKSWAATQIQQIEAVAAAYGKLHEAELDPQGYEQHQKTIQSLNEEYAKTEALAAMSDRLAAAQQHVADVQAHWSALIETARDSAQTLQTSLQGATELMSHLHDEAKTAEVGGPALNTFTRQTGPAEIDTWKKQQLGLISDQAQAGVNLVNASGLSSQEAASQIGAIRSAASTDSAAIVQAANTAKAALASLPEGLAQSAASFEETINTYKQKVDDLANFMLDAQKEMKARQEAIKSTTVAPTPDTSGLAGQFAPSSADLGSSTPGFLQQVPGFLQRILGSAAPTIEQVDALKRLIDTPVAGTGFLTQFEQQLATAKQNLSDVQDAAARTRQMFSDSQLFISNAQYAAQTQQNSVMRPIQDQGFDLQTKAYEEQRAQLAALRPVQEEQYQEEQKMYALRQQENAVMRPIAEDLWNYSQALQHEQDIMTSITRHYDSELIPLQREYNQLQREQTEIQHAQDLQDMQQSLSNQENTLSRLTPGTAAYLAVRERLGKAEADYAIKAKEYSLSDKIAEIQAEKDAAVQAEQARINAISDAQHAEQERQTVLQHGFDLEQRGIQDSLDANANHQSVLNHDFGLISQQTSDQISQNQELQRTTQHTYDVQGRGLSDWSASLTNFMANWNSSESKIETDDTNRINLAQLELTWANKVSDAWVNVPTATYNALQQQQSDAQRALSDWSTKYDVWKSGTLKPIQDAVEKIFTDSTGRIKDGFNAVIQTITGPNQLIDQLTALGKAQTKQSQDAVTAIQEQTKWLQNYYTLLDYINRYDAAGGQAPFGVPALPKGYLIPPGALGSKDNPNPTDTQGHPPAPPAPPTVPGSGTYPGTTGNPPPPGTATGQTVVGGFQDGGWMRISPLGTAAPTPGITNHNYGGTVIIAAGAITIQSQSEYYDGRAVLRSIVGYMGTSGTNTGWSI